MLDLVTACEDLQQHPDEKPVDDEDHKTGFSNQYNANRKPSHLSIFAILKGIVPGYYDTKENIYEST